jgi:hypothetical protein
LISTAAALLFGVVSLVAARPAPFKDRKEEARQFPLIGDVIEWIDPPPQCIAGEMAPPDGPPPGRPVPK